MSGPGGRLPRFGRRRAEQPPLPVVAGERVLAWASGPDGVAAGGTRGALLVRRPGEPDLRLPWQEVEAADWDAEGEVLRVVEVGTFGSVRPEHHLRLDDPGRLLQLVRERVTASIVLQRHVPVRDGKGVTVLGRRAPAGSVGSTGEDAGLAWFHRYDPGIDPEDPVVRRAADAATAAARVEVGDA